MNNNSRKSRSNGTTFIKPPDYPFSPHVLWNDLCAALSKEYEKKLSYPRLGKMMGVSGSNAYFWIWEYHHPQLLAYYCLLERLSPTARHAYIDAHCRVCPTLDHRRLFYPKGMREKVLKLAKKPAGLTVIKGGTDSLRSFMVTALGHAFVAHSGRRIAGLDIHRPILLVPVSGVFHLDQTLDPDQIRRAAIKFMPRLMVSKSPQVLLNGVWSRLPEARADILRLSEHKHVVIADKADTSLIAPGGPLAKPVHIVNVSTSQRRKEGIRVICQRQKKLQKRPQK